MENSREVKARKKFARIKVLAAELSEMGYILDYRYNNIVLIDHKMFNRHTIDLTDAEFEKTIIDHL